ncbi:MAG: lipopolysaccharide heptosyltransferase II [Candidatus Accumulibacter sp.]|jgi:heptosyltransferase-2|nr:lipopolysaccharide heptosyltransferase II [Accumulibacter sp.]
MEGFRALVVAPAWIGDAVMAQPLFMRLCRDIPGLRLDALAPPWVAPVLERMPEITEVIDNPFAHGELALRERFRLGRRLARRNYRRAYVLPNSAKSALLPFFAGIPERVGFTGEARYGLINRRHTLDKRALPRMVERFAQLAQMPGSPLARPVEPPRLTSSAEQRAETLKSLDIERPRRVAVFCPGAEYGPAKRWPARHFATLADALAERGFDVWLLGSDKDRPIGEDIARLTARGKPRNFCGKTSLAQAIDLIASADFVVCNDSGLMHVGAALGRPLVALFGSSSPEFTPPLSDRATVLRLGLACSPCFERDCPLGHLDCLNELEPQRVLEACSTTLADREIS